MENPTHISGTSTADLVLNPSYDWPGLNPYHARIVAFRAIENGANIFHHCMAGTSLAVDYLGNALAQTDYFSKSGVNPSDSCIAFTDKTCTNENIVAMMPTVGVKTLYGVVGDVLAWFCVATSIVLVFKFLVLGGGKKKGE